MSIIVEKFLKENQFNLSEGQHKLLESRDINHILSDYMVVGHNKNDKICIKNIVGYDYSWRNESNDLFTSFNNYFNNEGDLYHSRANSMLKYSIDNIVSILERSFVSEPISLLKVENDQYIIDINGIHRFHILKVAYLARISKSTTKEDAQKIDDEFSIPCLIHEIDVFKSYCNYILNTCKKEEYDKHFWLSTNKDNSEICEVEYNGEKQKYNVEQLLEFMINNINLDLLNKPSIIFPIRAVCPSCVFYPLRAE